MGKQGNLFGDEPPPSPDAPKKISIPKDAQPGTCSAEKCKARILWVLLGSNRWSPFDADGTPHWATCKDPGAFKADKKR